MEGRYSTYVDGKFLEIPSLDECFLAIKERIASTERVNEYLRKENQVLKDEHYENEEIKKLSQKLEEARADLRRGFGITKEEQEAIQKWKDKHDIEDHGLDTLDKKIRSGGAIGGRYTYEFIPTSIGTIGVIKCLCGKEFTFREL